MRLNREHQRGVLLRIKRAIALLGVSFVMPSLALASPHSRLQTSQHLRMARSNHQGAPLASVPELFVPSFPSFNSSRLDEQLRQYSVYLANLGAPDVLIVGSSRSLQGIDPTAFRHALMEQGYPELTIYNLSVNGATAQVVNLMIQDILTREQLPRVLVWAGGSRAFNSSRDDTTYRNIMTSQGYQHLATGVHPIPNWGTVLLNQDQGVNECWDLLDPWRAIQSSPTLLTPQLACSQSDGSSLLQPLSLRPAIRAQQKLQSQLDLRSSDIDATGFLAVDEHFDPAVYYQRHPRVSGHYDANYVPFELDGEQTRAAIALARFAHYQWMPLVFVNLPLSQDYLDPVRLDYEAQFRQHMQAIAAQEGFAFHDFNHGDLTQNHYFADPSHLNQHGAKAVGRSLATHSVIPRPVVQFGQ
ncbi:MAG: hypothetical protein ACFE0I_09355 [Elainellaceae cyanobacterium]